MVCFVIYRYANNNTPATDKYGSDFGVIPTPMMLPHTHLQHSPRSLPQLQPVDGKVTTFILYIMINSSMILCRLSSYIAQNETGFRFTHAETHYNNVYILDVPKESLLPPTMVPPVPSAVWGNVHGKDTINNACL